MRARNKTDIQATILRSTFFLVLLINALLPRAITAMDSPHKDVINCATCHTPAPSGAWWTDQGVSGGLCGQCHYPGSANGDAVTHITTGKYGNLEQVCTNCHNPHYQKQFRVWKTPGYLTTGTISAVNSTTLTRAGTTPAWTNNQWAGMLLVPDIRYLQYSYRIAGNTGTTITIDTSHGDAINLDYAKAAPPSTFAVTYGRLVKEAIGGLPVRFFRKSGANSFADGDAVIDGVCQVCHTRTGSFSQAGTLEGAGHPAKRAGTDCTQCHLHASSAGGFVANCGSCHGSPPIVNTLGGPDGLPGNDGGTGSTTPGAHQKHASTIGYSCDSCHAGGMPAASPIYDKYIQIGFSAGGGAFQGGAYDGRTLPLANGYGYAPGNAGTNITNAGSMSCSNVYCHSRGQSDNGGPLSPGDYAAPQWTVPSTGQCGTCHNTTAGSAPPSSGSHPKHAGAAASGNYALACTTCHYGFNETSPTHADGNVNVDIDPQYGGAAVSNADGMPLQRGFTSSTCSASYCHSNGASVSTGSIPANTSANWGSGTLACNSCHGNPPNYTNGSPKANNHSTHDFTCDNCHYATTTTGTTITNQSNHVNKTYDLLPGAGRSFSYTYASPGGTCSTISCHSNTGTAWGVSACLNCHSVPQGNRAAITPQFSGNSHHVQGVSATGSHCYHCHWEANSDGSINPLYHGGSTAPGSPVNLVVYGTGTRPASYAVGTTAVQYTANGTRAELAKITTHCLGCHSDKNNSTQPFGDGKTPRQYAWDGTSVDARYSQAGTTTWGKYTTVANAAQKNITKAYSAHGNAAANQEGWNTATGVDGTITDATGAVNVQCFDCHNSHGSTVSGTATSYGGGGILKDTVAGKGGYSVTYKPASGGSAADKNAYNPGAGLCFDCHMNANGGTTFPWGYNSTFNATQAIMGYGDTLYFGPGTSGPEQRYAYKSKSEKGGHFGASSNLASPPDSSHQINGLCTPCHDPHGVSPALGSNMNYGVPMLKGTWLTSPYKEDSAPANNAKGTVRDSTYPTGNDGTPREGVRYHLDQNTFGANIHASVTGITQTDTQFAGLCLNCHSKNSLTDGTNGGAWKSIDRIHESVKGWGANAKHKYTCSKCHTSHNSSLPRLMATNCLNKDHKGRVKYNPSPVLSGGGSGDDVGCYGDSTTLGSCWRFPQWSFVYGTGGGRMPGSWGGSYPGDYSITCHENRAADQSWNVKTPWAEDIPVINSGPAAGSFTAVGSNVQATITWQTIASYSTSYVDYGLTSSYGSTTGNGTLVLDHSVVLQNLINHSTYHYRVRSTSGLGNETVSGDNTFYISMPPTVPAFIHQANAICSPSCSVTLQWNASTDPDSGPIQYNVQASTDAAFTAVNYTSGWVSGTSVTTSALSTNAAYYWRVQARDANHTTAQDPPSAWSSTDSFLISDGDAPPQVTLASPVNGTGFADLYCGGSPAIGFSWNAAPPLAEYSVQISTDSTFTTVNYSSGWISGTSWSAVITPGATYYWRIQARDAVSYATAPWSSTWSFSVTDLGCKSSCPFVYVWDGEKYQYLTDIQGSAIGYPPDSYLAKYVTMFQPMYIVLNGLSPDGSGKYSVKLRETLSEISYVDEAKLLAVDYPQGYEIASSAAEGTYRYGYVNPFKLYTLRAPRPPISAVDKNGADILALVSNVDGNLAPEELNAFDFFTLDFGQIDPVNAKLVIDGWSVYGNEYKTTLPKTQPYIEVMDGSGKWVKVKSFGVPAGDMKRMVIDLSNVFLSNNYRIKVRTGADSGLAWRIDRIMIDDSAPVPVTVREVSADYADLHHRGMAPHSGSNFDHRITGDDGVLPDNPAAYGYGSFTRYGDVISLLNAADDMFAIMRHGDEISMTFPGAGLPPLPLGMVRGLVLKADVYYKTFRVDNNVELLPFHGMSIYPYDPAVENYPADADHTRYRSDYNTRTY